MDRILNAINKLPNVRGRRIAGGGNGDTRVQAEAGNSVVKIETSPVARGTVLVPAPKRVSPAVEEQFGFAETQVVAFEDLYGGKFHAALDRQHPRDLYDVKLLYENEGITDDLSFASSLSMSLVQGARLMNCSTQIHRRLKECSRRSFPA